MMGTDKIRLFVTVALLCGLPGCTHTRAAKPPPDARRPIIKTESEMAAARQQRVETGRVVPSASPTLTIEKEEQPPPRPSTTPITPTPGAIEADILLIDDTVLTLPEVLYSLWPRIIEARGTLKTADFANTVQEMLYVQIQHDIGSALIQREALANISDPQREVIEGGVEREIHARISRDFGDSAPRFEEHLSKYGLTLEQYQALLQREMVARQYTREKLLPKVFIRRDELLAAYQRDLAEYSTEEIRELWMIEAPFDTFLPEGMTWDRAPETQQAQARLRATRHIRAAQDALSSQSFEEVAREYSRGLHAAEGGAWGEIGRPLQAPYAEASKLIFGYSANQYSQPLEIAHGWCIVQCGRITHATRQSFADVQDEIRQKLTERKLQKLSSAYMIRIAANATVSGAESFMRQGLRRVLEASPTPPDLQ
ncbi:MAG: peptidylprolyl isomerase [Planctomycetota bacterium]